MGPLKYYAVDASGNVTNLRLSCPACGPGTYMGIHTINGEERHHCGTCSTTLSIEPQTQAPEATPTGEPSILYN